MQKRGDRFEQRAAQWLVARRGMKLLARNFRCRTGEIDIVALDGEQLVFVEVRARMNPRFASAAASVDQRKQRRLVLSAHNFLQAHPKWANRPARFDVIAFEPPQSGVEPSVRWIRAAFTA